MRLGQSGISTAFEGDNSEGEPEAAISASCVLAGKQKHSALAMAFLGNGVFAALAVPFLGGACLELVKTKKFGQKAKDKSRFIPRC